MCKKVLDELKNIILDVLDEERVRIYLFGSWARHEEKQSSDIDIAIEPISLLPTSKWTDLIDRVEESTIPYRVEFVNLSDASDELKINVEREGVLWKDYNKG
ncbi:nucleotidyltransferase family protein [Aquibacillus salsiterrae]|uniref:Nucleotidyltransferase domain-containing protein n=1 Tax=Aquibacillus salsiterrae TaxID=2950439 RepID=A0A9X3WJN3_9BACI|nr:nucleotidyltransferase domain-containing protein [Aquibacillus salsiterrae]MDC3418564.1 nucleotidyltransferase domain-containing protein [Aquibacillus salsiterrae]